MQTKKDTIKYLITWAQSSIRDHQRNGYTVLVEWWELIEMLVKSPKCNYCGCELKRKKGKSAPNSATVDRVNSGQIMTKDNIQLLCRTCNASKQGYSHKEFVEFCTMMSQR